MTEEAILVEATTSRFRGNFNIEDKDRPLANELEASLINSKLPCALAFKMVRKLNITPQDGRQ